MNAPLQCLLLSFCAYFTPAMDLMHSQFLIHLRRILQADDCTLYHISSRLFWRKSLATFQLLPVCLMSLQSRLSKYSFPHSGYSATYCFRGFKSCFRTSPSCIGWAKSHLSSRIRSHISPKASQDCTGGLISLHYFSI